MSRRLDADLRRRGVRAADREEVIQETAARALATGPEFLDADDLLRWAKVVARRVSVDTWRQSRRLTGEPVPERAATVDVARTVEGRVALRAVHTAMDTLSDDDRTAVISGLVGCVSGDRKADVRDGVRRFRARGRLRALTNGLAAWVGGVFAWRRLARPARKAVAFGTPSVVFAAFLVLPSLSGGQPNGPVFYSPRANTPAAGHQVIIDVDAVRPVPAAVLQAGQEHLAVVAPRPTAPRALPAAAAAVPAPGDSTFVRERPKTDSDHFWCVSVAYQGACVDPPLPHLPLP